VDETKTMTGSRRPRWRETCLGLVGLALALLACSQPATSGSQPDAPSADLGNDDLAADLPGDDADAGDAEVGDADIDDAGPTEPPPLAPASEPEGFPIYDWRIAVVPASSATDPVMDALEAGTFELPEVGVDDDGLQWTPWELGERGEIPGASNGVIYAAAQFYTGYPFRVMARGDSVSRIYMNGVPQPGDLYHTRRHRTPFLTQPGNNLVVVQALAGRHDPEVEFVFTEDELFFNLLDLTVFDLVPGDVSDQFVGVAVLNLSGRAAREVTARVVENDTFEETALVYPSLGPGAVTQVAFLLRPKAPFVEAPQVVPVELRLESPSLDWSYAAVVELNTAEPGAPFRRTFRSRVDGSAQYYGVVPPSDFDGDRAYGLVLTLHGAGVQAINQARSYSPKDWTYIIAPTNRRPFGFDWEAWGRLDGIEVLDDATRSYRIDPERVYLTGHSMGGHGAWQLGVHFPGRFAVVGPSAGWASFESYTGRTPPTGAFGRAQAASNTLDYLQNLANRGVYIIHGDADDNVPVREGRAMAEACAGVTDDLVYHEEPGAGHWWDGDASPGVDCVDWPPLFEFMRERSFDPTELDFSFRSVSPWVSPTHSYVTIRSARDAYADCVVTSETVADDTVALTTENVRSLTVAGDVLRDRGVTTLIIDDEPYDVPDGVLAVGPQDGKRPGVHGPLNEVFHRPFCFAYPEDGPPAYREYAAYLLSEWALIGNGHGCALPASEVSSELREAYNLVYLGVTSDDLPVDEPPPLSWTRELISVGRTDYHNAAVVLVFPDSQRLQAAAMATEGSEYLLFRVQPFTSGFAVPDYLVWSERGGEAAGFFEADWGL
jgi:poly(3-hydroxybutyrate) depolymerase